MGEVIPWFDLIGATVQLFFMLAAGIMSFRGEYQKATFLVALSVYILVGITH